MTRLEGQRAFVTGAASGFGLGIARAFAREGAAVMLADLNHKAAADAADGLVSQGFVAQATEVNISDRSSLDAAMDEAEKRLGGLSIVVANAGIGQRPKPFEDTETSVLLNHYEINAIGAFNTCQAALPALRRHGAGASILLTVSGIALVPRPQLYAYGMAKAAAGYFMKSLALELAPEGIRVNGLFPAIADTPMLAEFAGGARTEESVAEFARALPLGRLITPEDVGAAAVYLSSPTEAAAMTGFALAVDDGRTI